MDTGDLSISAASLIASQPRADQSRIVAMPQDEVSANAETYPKGARTDLAAIAAKSDWGEIF
jgi:hypothetical protein